MNNDTEFIKEIKYCDSTKTKYLKTSYRKMTVIIFANQRYLVEWLLQALFIKSDKFKDLESACTSESFYLFLFAVNHKNFIKSIMFKKWRIKDEK